MKEKEREIKDNKELNETETQIVSIYLCQMLGCPTTNQIKKVLKEKMNVDLGRVSIKNALNAAKKRGILSVNHVQNEGGEVEDGYSMKDVRFSNPPEIAHITNVLPKLLADEGAKQIFDLMEEEHVDGERKGGRLPDIRDYKKWKVRFKTVLPILGGQPFGDGDDSTNKNIHRRIGDKIWIPGNLHLKAAIRDELRQYNINESKAIYIKISDYFFNPKKELIQVVCPSPPTRKGGAGTGLTTFEALQSGEILEFVIDFPTTNGISSDVMRSILSNGGLRIGARHKDYGLVHVDNIEEIK